jgi:hypothetical protein
MTGLFRATVNSRNRRTNGPGLESRNKGSKEHAISESYAGERNVFFRKWKTAVNVQANGNKCRHIFKVAYAGYCGEYVSVAGERERCKNAGNGRNRDQVYKIVRLFICMTKRLFFYVWPLSFSSCEARPCTYIAVCIKIELAIPIDVCMQVRFRAETHFAVETPAFEGGKWNFDCLFIEIHSWDEKFEKHLTQLKIYWLSMARNG